MSRRLFCRGFGSVAANASKTKNFILITRLHPLRTVSYSSIQQSNKSTGRPKDLQSIFRQQLEEIKYERESFVGESDHSSNNSPQVSGITPPGEGITHGELAKYSYPSDANSNQTARSISEEAHAEREALFQFSEEEIMAWKTYGEDADPQKLLSINESLRLEDKQPRHKMKGEDTVLSTPHEKPFTHLTPQEDGVNMVDIGTKNVTRRVAVARSSVVFPAEVMDAFHQKIIGSQPEMIGPKGPIFETAKIAGIMGAKRTSELIPLCHPIPLDSVNINIELTGNKAIIECKCSVTHKTGVEMEALVGSSIAALTIYDMVKAVSHRVEVEKTTLVTKTGGKRTVGSKFLNTANEMAPP